VARTTLVTLAGLLIVVALVIYASVGMTLHRCEVCVAFEGRHVCRTVESATEDDARMGATTNACALVASGVTETVRCQQTPPVRAACTPAE
jgi:hypothetical protein